MNNDIFEKMTEEERASAWMYMIFNKDLIKEKTKQLSKEAEKAGMTLEEYLESISPWPDKNGKDCGKEIKMKKYEQNKAYAEKLATLIADHPDMRVIAWIDIDEINEDCCCVAGNIYEPHIETLVIGKNDGIYHEKENSQYDDCCHYYGREKTDEWLDEEIEEKAKQIPWEDVISVRIIRC